MQIANINASVKSVPLDTSNFRLQQQSPQITVTAVQTSLQPASSANKSRVSDYTSTDENNQHRYTNKSGRKMKIATPNEDPKKPKKNLRHATFGRQRTPQADRTAVAVDANDILMDCRRDTSNRPRDRYLDIRDPPTTPHAVTVPSHATDVMHQGSTTVESINIVTKAKILTSEQSNMKNRCNNQQKTCCQRPKPHSETGQNNAKKETEINCLDAAIPHKIAEDSASTHRSDIVPTVENRPTTVRPKKYKKRQKSTAKRKLHPVDAPTDAPSVSSPFNEFSEIINKH